MDIYEQARKAVTTHLAPDMHVGDPNLSRAFSESMNTTGRNVVGDAMQGATQEDAEEQKRREAEARAAENARRKEQAAKAESNAQGEGWTQIKKDDGGFDYYDAYGKRVNLWTFAQYTGKDPRDILKNSENALDMQFVADYDNTEKAMKAYAGNKQNDYWKNVAREVYGELPGDMDKEKRKQEALRRAGDIRSRFEEGGSPQSALQKLRDYYPNVFGRSGVGSVGKRFAR